MEKGNVYRDHQQNIPDKIYDITIVGAGVVGCALAWRLSMFQLKILLVDKNDEVGEGTSKGNSAIIHTGFDATPGSLESRLVTSASRDWPDVAKKLKIPFKMCSAIVVAQNEEQLAALPGIISKARENGVTDVEIMDRDQVLAAVPHVHPGVLGGVFVKQESIVDPFTTTIAYAEVALQNGVDILLGAAVQALEDKESTVKILRTGEGNTVKTKIVINVAGLGGQEIARMYQGTVYDLNPRRGQFVIYDKTSAFLSDKILLPIPTKKTKGMLVCPTIFGNLLAGPTAEDLPLGDPAASFTTYDGINAVKDSAKLLVPNLAYQPSIATYAGARCNCEQGSYIIHFNDGEKDFVTVNGVRSTGLTTSFALADYLIEGLREECGLVLKKNDHAVDQRPDHCWPGWWTPPYTNPQKIKERPAYGQMMCYCENISRGEIEDVLNSTLTPKSPGSLKRRTRASMGRCQGFNCGVPLSTLLSKKLKGEEPLHL
ncbi:MAG: NAD(P)/FAD-dependent oxidoreductase [Cyclobacteriaceae bacterium]|nr:NAD(P)/FAD-dependent oxidoreductase [Cyclobacteriaceae bacterium]